MTFADPNLPHSAEALNNLTRSRSEPQRGLAPKTRRTLCASAIAFADAAGFGLGIAFIAAIGGAALAPEMAVIGGMALCLNWIYGLYPSDRLHAQEILRRRALTAVMVMVLVAGCVGVVLGKWDATLKIELVFLFAVALQTPLRMIARSGLRRAGLWGTPTDFICGPDLTSKLEASFAKHWQYGLIPAAGNGSIAATSYLPDTQEALALRQRYSDVVVLADLPDLRVSGLNPADFGGGLGLWMGRSAHRGTGAVKRAIDLAIAIPAVLVAAPFVLVAAAAIWVVDPGPVHYIQEREGFRGTKLRVFKLRTMYRDAEARLQDVLRNNPAANAEWQSHFKLRNDPRILPGIGSFLRVSSVDELPQLLNVLSGEMSIVGPRPFPEYHLAAMPVEFRVKRRSVVPGITGLWQISARSEADLVQQQQLDEHYIDNQSIWLDLQIVLGTFAALVGRKGAY